MSDTLFKTAGISAFKTASSFSSEDLGRRSYRGPASGRQVTALSSRLFGTWTLLTAVVRTYAAYNVGNKEVYAIAFSTYAIALMHFSSEWLVYKTMTMGRGLLPAFTVALITPIWMAGQWGYYTAS